MAIERSLATTVGVKVGSGVKVDSGVDVEGKGVVVIVGGTVVGLSVVGTSGAWAVLVVVRDSVGTSMMLSAGGEMQAASRTSIAPMKETFNHSNDIIDTERLRQRTIIQSNLI